MPTRGEIRAKFAELRGVSFGPLTYGHLTVSSPDVGVMTALKHELELQGWVMRLSTIRFVGVMLEIQVDGEVPGKTSADA